jgi:hypothetical protein
MAKSRHLALWRVNGMTVTSGKESSGGNKSRVMVACREGRAGPVCETTSLLDSGRRFHERWKVVNCSQVGVPLWTHDPKLPHLGNQSGAL